jgi:hypothetical protein
MASFECRRVEGLMAVLHAHDTWIVSFSLGGSTDRLEAALERTILSM